MTQYFPCVTVRFRTLICNSGNVGCTMTPLTETRLHIGSNICPECLRMAKLFLSCQNGSNFSMKPTVPQKRWQCLLVVDWLLWAEFDCLQDSQHCATSKRIFPPCGKSSPRFRIPCGKSRIRFGTHWWPRSLKLWTNSRSKSDAWRGNKICRTLPLTVRKLRPPPSEINWHVFS